VNHIEHIIEPTKLLLSWQSPTRGRHIVAELHRNGEDADLAYLRDTEDYAAAKAKGFAGEYPGFPADKDYSNVLAAFMRRLPPRSRSDFDKFMDAIRIPSDAEVSDFALLGYAGAKLPGDDFYIIHPFDEAQPPFEFLLQMAGYRHYRSSVPYEDLNPGMTAQFELEPNNQHDPKVVRIIIPDISPETAGYVCRGLVPQFRKWMAAGLQVSGTIERKNGISDHPQVYLFVTVRN
jgi:hypothetical protein